MSDWKKHKLEDFCTKVVSGGTPLRSMLEYYVGGKIPWLKTGEVKKEIIWETEEFITETGLANSSAKLIPRHSVIVAMYGDGDTAGHVAVNEIELCTNQACCNFIVDRTKADYKFIYYYLKGSYQNLVNLKLGGSQQNLNAASLRSFEVAFPSLRTQKKIASILSAYDDLIENNKRRIAILEKMAEEIYREWFVRMRFPGSPLCKQSGQGITTIKFSKGRPLLWQTVRVKDIVDRLRFGQIYRQEELTEEGNVVVIDQSTAEQLGYYDGEPAHSATAEKPILLFGDHSCKMLFMTRPFSLAENVIPFRPSTGVSAYFLFHLIKGLATTTEYKRHWTDLMNREVLLPTADLQLQYEQIVITNHQQIDRLKIINKLLCKTRDLLLPRLISGKLSVEDLELPSNEKLAAVSSALPQQELAHA